MTQKINNQKRFENKQSEFFELRTFSSRPEANGETDFKGETAVFTTEERIDYLETYADVASRFFGDPQLDTPAVTADEVEDVRKGLKPQPLPNVRQRLALENWRWQTEVTNPSPLPKPEIAAGIDEEGDFLQWREKAVFRVGFPGQSWRAFFWMDLVLPSSKEETVLDIGESLKIRLVAGAPLTANGREFGEALTGGEALAIKIEWDAVSGRCNVLCNGIRVAEWIPLAKSRTTEALTIQGAPGLRLTSCRGLGFDQVTPADCIAHPDQPYFFNPLFKADYHARGDAEGWQKSAYDDSAWREGELPLVHGGVMEAGEDLLLRKKVFVPKFSTVILHSDALDPEGEIWVNGRLAHRHEGPEAFEANLTRWLVPDAENLIAIRVCNRPKIAIRHRHACTDRFIGWFLGRTWLDLKKEVSLRDLFVFTKSLELPAEMAWEVDVENRYWAVQAAEPVDYMHFEGILRLEISPWFPDDGAIVATTETPVRLDYNEPLKLSGTISIPNPEPWSVERPFLYKVRAVLLDSEGREWDDLVITAGLRTVSQEGGQFRINGKPSMMNGALVFATLPPIEDQSRYLRCGTEFQITHDLLAAKALGGNTVRMSIHTGGYGGVNNPRFAEIGDQLGVLFQWTTNAWVRTSTPWQLDFGTLGRDVRRVRNHPSIVMWQPSNHPSFYDWETDSSRWLTRVMETILAEDSSRLINPCAHFDRMRTPANDAGTLGRQGQQYTPHPYWKHPLLARGAMETITGYGAEWSLLRKWPGITKHDWGGGWVPSDCKIEYLNSPTHAFFDFESEESAAQANWELVRGQPFYRVRSYEVDMDKHSIGRQLDFEEWRTSQAWQAFSAYESYRKKRLFDCDGMAWCTLDGGANSGTYEKPLTDARGHKKLAFHTVRMAFQPTLAGSADVDIVYGPNDAIRPAILHLGSARKVDLEISIETPNGQKLATQSHTGISLEAGRNRTDLPPWVRPDLPDGTYVIRYTLQEASKNDNPVNS